MPRSYDKMVIEKTTKPPPRFFPWCSKVSAPPSFYELCLSGSSPQQRPERC